MKIVTLMNQASGYLFNTHGHSIENLTIAILGKILKKYHFYRKQNGKYLLQKSGIHTTRDYIGSNEPL